MDDPPVAQFLDHGRRDGHVTVLAALAVADVQTRRGFFAVEVPDFDGHRFPHAQAAMIHQPQAGPEPRLAHDRQQRLHLGAPQHDGQHFRLGNADFLEDRPALHLDAVQIEGPQGILGRLHRAVFVMLVLAQEEEVLADLVLGERGRVALEMFGEFADVPDILLFGGRPVIF